MPAPHAFELTVALSAGGYNACLVPRPDTDGTPDAAFREWTPVGGADHGAIMAQSSALIYMEMTTIGAVIDDNEGCFFKDPSNDFSSRGILGTEEIYWFNSPFLAAIDNRGGPSMITELLTVGAGLVIRFVVFDGLNSYNEAGQINDEQHVFPKVAPDGGKWVVNDIANIPQGMVWIRKITTQTGGSTRTNQWSIGMYRAAGDRGQQIFFTPSLDSLDVTSGTILGGTAVELICTCVMGVGIGTPEKVRFGGTDVDAITGVTDGPNISTEIWKIRVTTPAHAAGTVDVEVDCTYPDGSIVTVTLAAAYTYIGPDPDIDIVGGEGSVSEGVVVNSSAFGLGGDDFGVLSLDIELGGSGPGITGGIQAGGSPAIFMVKDASGIYTLVEGKTHDTLYDRQPSVTTIEAKIPDPFVKFGFLP